MEIIDLFFYYICYNLLNVDPWRRFYSMNKQSVFIIIISFFIICSCTTGQRTPEELIIGTWKFVGVNCQNKGMNCQDPRGRDTKTIEFKEGGLLVTNTGKTIRYKLLNGSFEINDGVNTISTVNIIHLDKKILITGEVGKRDTERLERIR